MSDTPDQNRKWPVVVGGLLLGLAPIPIWLLIGPSNQARPPAFYLTLWVVCLTCHLVGGMCVFVNVRSVAFRIIAGIFVAAFFFVLTMAIVLFQACSKSFSR